MSGVIARRFLLFAFLALLSVGAPAASPLGPAAADDAASSAPVNAAEAFARKRCAPKDFAHIFIGAARSLGIPARYVRGYFRRPDKSADTSHACDDDSDSACAVSNDAGRDDCRNVSVHVAGAGRGKGTGWTE